MKNKALICTTIAMLVTVLLLGVSSRLSKSYFTSEIDNTYQQEIDVKSGKLVLSYTDCANTVESDCSNITANLKPGGSVSKTFQLKNDSTLNRNIIFGIQFSSILNTFQNDELLYIIKDMDTNEVVAEGNVPYKLTTEYNVPINSRIEIEKDETKKYQITFTFKYLEDTHQSYNEFATFQIKMGAYILSEL